MKELKKLRLSSLSKSELQAREMNKLLGGENCCICGCTGPSSTVDNGNSNYSGGQYTPGGGSYAPGSYS